MVNYRRMIGGAALVAVAAAVAGGSLRFGVAGENPGPVYTDPEEARQRLSYRVLGEYVGTIATRRGDEPFGIHVVPLREAERDPAGRATPIRVVFYRGGLPGAGWTGEGQDVHETDGSIRRWEEPREPLTYVHDAFTTTFADDTLTIGPREGELIGDLVHGITGKLEKVNRRSPTLGEQPPEGAVVLFDGTSLDPWREGRMTDDGLLEAEALSEREFGDHTVHLEFRMSFIPNARQHGGIGLSRARLLIQGRYAIDLADAFGRPETYGVCTLFWSHRRDGGLTTGHQQADANPLLPPLTWQTLRVEFTAARFDDAGNKTENARMTVDLNGVRVHDDAEVPQPAEPEESERGPGPLRLTAPAGWPGPRRSAMNMGPPRDWPFPDVVTIQYRNIWIVNE